jgi:cytochrome c biogenesis factor
LGIAALAVGVAGSSLGSRQYELQMREGEVVHWNDWRIDYGRLIQREVSDKLIAEVELRISRGSNEPVTLMPARHFHLLQNEWTTEVAIHSTWGADFYTILNGGLGEGRVALTFVENPLMRWIWVGSAVTALGVAIVSWPTRNNRQLAKKRQDTQQLSAENLPQRLAA